MNYQESLDISIDKITIKSYLQKLDIQKVREEIIKGLTARDKYISSKFFYDEKGSILFEKITQLPEYYPARTEKGILNNMDMNFINRHKNLNIWELGSGDHTKISLLINRIPEHLRNTLTYHPVDISKSAIQIAAEKLLEIYPEIKITGFVADFVHQLHIIPQGSNRLFCFLGSTIGNFTVEQRLNFLTKMSEIMNDDDLFLLGADTIKSINVLEAAYNDNQGVTAAFNLNILNVVNSICKTNFNLNDFRHIAFFNKDKKRIEMHLEAKNDVSIKSRYSHDEILIKKGERIHTENSHKFDDKMILSMTHKSGFEIAQAFSDDKNWFKLVLLKKLKH